MTHQTFNTTAQDMANLFILKGNRSPKGNMIPVRDNRDPHVPEIDPSYLFDGDQLKKLILWNNAIGSSNFYIGGPAGCGKSSLFEQFAARINRPVFRVGCAFHTRMEDFKGQFTLKVKDGVQVTEFVPGPLINAMKTGGILLLDEGDTLNPSTLLALNTIFDRAPLLVPETEELIIPHPDFRVAMTGNTMGAGDESGLMRGTTRQNLAVMDRFMLLSAGYMDLIDEARVLHAKVPSLPSAIMQNLLQVAQDIRNSFLGIGQDNEATQRCEIALSTRGVLRAAQIMACFVSNGKVEDKYVIDSLDTAFLGRASAVDRQFVISMAQRHQLID